MERSDSDLQSDEDENDDAQINRPLDRLINFLATYLP